MKDLFYTILVVWIIWRIISSVQAHRNKQFNHSQPAQRKNGETKVDYIPPTKNKIKDDEGEYVDYEEIK